MGGNVELGLLVVLIALDAWALAHIWRSTRLAAAKLLWSLVVLALPMLGMSVWALAGPRRGKVDRSSRRYRAW